MIKFEKVTYSDTDHKRSETKKDFITVSDGINYVHGIFYRSINDIPEAVRSVMYVYRFDDSDPDHEIDGYVVFPHELDLSKDWYKWFMDDPKSFVSDCQKEFRCRIDELITEYENAFNALSINIDIPKTALYIILSNHLNNDII